MYDSREDDTRLTESDEDDGDTTRYNDYQSILNLKIIFSKHFHFYVHYLILDDNDNEEMKMTKFGVKHDEEAQVNGHTCIFVLYCVFLHYIVNALAIYIFKHVRL
jgi:hypothetical protein